MARWTLNKSVNQTNKITFHTFCCKNENIFGRFLLWEVEWQKHMFCILGKNVPGMPKNAPWANLVSVGFLLQKNRFLWREVFPRQSNPVYRQQQPLCCFVFTIIIIIIIIIISIIIIIIVITIIIMAIMII